MYRFVWRTTRDARLASDCGSTRLTISGARALLAARHILFHGRHQCSENRRMSNWCCCLDFQNQSRCLKKHVRIFLHERWCKFLTSNRLVQIQRDPWKVAYVSFYAIKVTYPHLALASLIASMVLDNTVTAALPRFFLEGGKGVVKYNSVVEAAC